MPLGLSLGVGSALAGGGGLPNTIVVELASGYLYARYPWDATYDAVQRVTVSAVSASSTSNGCVQPNGIRLIPIATSRTGMVAAFNAAVSAKTITYEGDDSAPLKYNNTFIGGNHGVAVGIKITATAHGKTVADIGSEWSDGSKSVWIIAVVDANTLVCILNNIGANDERWFFFTNLVAGTLTHVTGATNTGSITFTTPLTQQLFPCVQNHTRTITLNGTTTVSSDGVYDCRYVTIDESYGVANPESMRDYFIAGRPWSTAPAYNDPAIATQVEVAYSYRIDDNGSMSIASRFETLQAIGLNSGSGYVGFTQASPINYLPGSGETLNFYVPRINPIVGSVKTWDFEAGETISGSFETISFAKASWDSATNAPDRMVQYVKSSGGTRLRGMAVGYSRLSGAGANLDDYIIVAGNISSSRKMYPYALTKSAPAFGAPADALPAGSIVEATAYRVPYNLADIPDATTAAVRLTDSGAEVVLDFHTNVTAYAVPVPAKLNGKTVSIVDGNGNLTLDSSTVSNGEIVVSVTGSYGAAVLEVA